MTKDIILKVENLQVSLKNKKDSIPIIPDLSFSLKEGECLGVLGESGSGKSISIKSVLGLLDTNFAVSGKAVYGNRIDLLQQSKESLRRYRGEEITMILQNPMTCFDPLYRIEDQIAETWRSHQQITVQEARTRALDLLERMQIANGEEVLRKYPHQLSGGMLQRVMIGLALSMNPRILVADEPTTAIDAITQYEIMKEFQKIKAGGKTAMIFISHDLGVISQIADRILVMNGGRIADQGEFAAIVKNPVDDYTKMLIKSKEMVMRRYRLALQGGGEG